MTGNEASNPYVNARREWNERYGSYIVRARRMTWLAIISATSTVLAVSGIIYMGTQNKFIPYVVETRCGVPSTVAPLNVDYSIDSRVTEATIANWIVNLRNVSSDPVVQKKAIEQVYAMLQDGHQAKNFVDDFFKNEGNPYERSVREFVSVHIESILSISDSTFRVEWLETTWNRSGILVNEKRMVGSVSFQFVPPLAATIYLNPLGLIIDKLNLSTQF